MRAILTPLAAAAVLVSAACSVFTDASSGDSSLLAAFESAPLGMSNVSTTFSTSASQDSTPWGPPGRPGHEFGPRGPGEVQWDS